MKEVITYLSFDGNCKEAMTFYAKCMGAELFLHPYSAGPMDVPADAKDRIMHATITKGAPILMASDMPPGMATKQGNNFSISVTCESLEEIERLFTAIGEKGTVKMPLENTFWGARFGMLTDRFGINWMFSFELPK